MLVSPLCRVMQALVRPVLPISVKGGLDTVLAIPKADARSVEMAPWVRCLWHKPEDMTLRTILLCAPVIPALIW